MSVVEHPGVQWTDVTVDQEIDETAARRTLRAQIARLERDLVEQATGAFPVLSLAHGAGARRAAPRLLSLGELEQARDDLSERLHAVTLLRREHADRQAFSRGLLERMLRSPAEHKWLRVSNAELGEPGCKSFHVKPRLGLVGMLAGWWHVKVSSGCPLAWGMSC